MNTSISARVTRKSRSLFLIQLLFFLEFYRLLFCLLASFGFVFFDQEFFACQLGFVPGGKTSLDMTISIIVPTIADFIDTNCLNFYSFY